MGRKKKKKSGSSLSPFHQNKRKKENKNPDFLFPIKKILYFRKTELFFFNRNNWGKPGH
jgi:hypothetical protein